MSMAQCVKRVGSRKRNKSNLIFFMLDAKKIRRLILKISYEAKACHIGSALSCVEILIDIFNQKRKRDYFIFSKASGVAAYYAILAELGVIPQSKLVFYLKHYPLVSKEVLPVMWSGGSLGHGLPIAVGLAYSNRKKNVYVLIGDAEVQEGTFWESILFAAHHKLNNLKIYLDCNKLQALGETKRILTINKALKQAQKIFPIRIYNTIKGKCVKEIDGDYIWHYRNMNYEQYNRFTKSIF